jgi:hypothetical protein
MESQPRPSSAQPDHTPGRSLGLAEAAVTVFWTGVFAFVSVTLFFLVLGAPAPWVTRGAAIVFGTATVLFVARLIWARMHRREMAEDPRLRGARERRGY